MAKMKPDAAALAAQPTIVIPPKKIRTVTIGVVFAIVFASLGVGFAFGRITAVARTGTGSFTTGGIVEPRPGEVKVDTGGGQGAGDTPGPADPKSP
jgi:hypothetical protein